MRWIAVVLAGIVCLGCDLPRDPEETYERARGGTIRAGVSENPPWTRWKDGEPAGVEVDLIEDFAGRLDAEVEWFPAAESELIESLHQGRLDVVVGGLTDDSPWLAEVALTRPFAEVGQKSHVMAVRHGENRWLFELEKFLEGRSAEVQRQLAAEHRP